MIYFKKDRIPECHSMLYFKKILIPVDFSGHSKLAAKKAISLAQIYKSAVYFLHVGEEAKKSAERLCNFVNEINPENSLIIRKLVAQGIPAPLILSTARKLGADAIVMGSRGLSGIKHLMQGSVAEKVLREAPCPVIVIKKKKPSEFSEYMLPQIRDVEGTFHIDKILVPLDFSPASKQAFCYAVTIASRYNSTIYTLTVFDRKYKEFEREGKEHTTIVIRGKKIQLGKEFPTLLQAANPKKLNISLKRLLLDGDPFSRIESIVQKKEIDLIIMGTHGRSGLEHLLVGSVAEKVIRTVDCPVMTVRVKNISK